MGKPPTTDQELQARVAALEERADTTDAELASLDARVTALEDLVTVTPPPEPPDGAWGGVAPPVIDHTLPTPEPPQPPATGRVVTILLDGASHVFTQEGGTDLGGYTDPQGRFVQHCIAAKCDTLPDFLVMFRPDADGGREEVVFEFGRCHGNPTGSVLGAYSAVITRDGETLADIDVPKHYYYSRWRWQSAPRPVTVTVAELIAAHLVPPYGKTLVPGMRAGVHADDGPMQLNGITPYMPQTGERDDIGILTESQADYLMYEDAQGLGTARAWLEGSGVFPWHTRDENTGAPISFVTYPNASTNWRLMGDPQLATGYQEDLSPDASHEPALSYLPFMLTGDPYALEELQFMTTLDYIQSIGNLGQQRFCWDDSLRSHAWHLRNAMHCAVATPTSVPAWLLPKSYWQIYIENALAFEQGVSVNMPAGSYQQRFRDMSGLNLAADQPGGMIPCLQEAYAMAVYCHASDLGLAGWSALRDWKMEGLVARSDGTSGYNRSIPDAYVRAVTDPASVAFADWRALWDYNVATDPTYYSGADPTQQHLAAGVELGYCTYMAGTLNWAVRQGIAAAAPCAGWLGAEMAGKWRYLRWAIA